MMCCLKIYGWKGFGWRGWKGWGGGRVGWRLWGHMEVKRILSPNGTIWKLIIFWPDQSRWLFGASLWVVYIFFVSLFICLGCGVGSQCAAQNNELSIWMVEHRCPTPFPSNPFRKVCMSVGGAAPLHYCADPTYNKQKKLKACNFINENPSESDEIRWILLLNKSTTECQSHIKQVPKLADCSPIGFHRVLVGSIGFWRILVDAITRFGRFVVC